MPRPATKQPKPIKVINIDNDITVEIIDWHTWPISRGYHNARKFHYEREIPILEKMCDLYLTKSGPQEIKLVLSKASRFSDWLAQEGFYGEDGIDTADSRKYWFPRIKRKWQVLQSAHETTKELNGTSSPHFHKVN